METTGAAPIHRALYRPSLVLGGERELVLMTAVACGGVAVSGMNFVSVVIGGSVWLIAITLLQWMAKFDPHLSKVYLRHIRYRRYYSARPSPYCKE